MKEDGISMAPRPPLMRAFAWGGFLWCLSLVLPVRVEFGESLWATDLLGTASGLQALGASAFAGIGLLLLSLGTATRPASSRALAGLTLAAVGLAGLMCDPETQSSLLTNMPAGLTRGYVALLVLTATAAAGLRAVERNRALILFAVSIAAAAFIYLWPHPFGALWQHTARDFTQASLLGPQFRASLTAVVLCGLPAGLLASALLGRVVARPGARKVISGWIIGLPAVMLVALSIKLAAQQGIDSHVLVGLRSALVFLSLVLTTSFAAQVFSPHAPTAGSRKFRIAAHGLSLGGLALALAPHLQSPVTQSWVVGASPRWALNLYAEDIPNIAAAAADVDLPGGPALLQARISSAMLTADSAPELAQAVASFGYRAQNPGENRRALRQAAVQINDAARSAHLPFYLDLQLIGSKRATRSKRWTASIRTYRIEQARRFAISKEVRSSLWLSRLDTSRSGETRLGWTGHDAHEGMVMLDVVRDHWRQDLLPALVGHAPYPQMKIYSRHARVLSADLVNALAPEVPADVLGKLLQCAAEGNRNAHCRSTQRSVEPRLLHILAQKVEAHELRHAADGARLAPPARLLSVMTGHSEDSMHFAASELSAYLAEVASCPVPRLALAHFYALSKARPRSPEGFAGRVAFDILAAQTGLSPHQLIDRPAEEVAQAAAEAHRRLFGQTLARPRPLDPMPRDAGNQPPVLGLSQPSNQPIRPV